ncbi:MAG: hypothetical protein ACT4QA_23290 [Panacagrimonas sp.]
MKTKFAVAACALAAVVTTLAVSQWPTEPPHPDMSPSESAEIRAELRALRDELAAIPPVSPSPATGRVLSSEASNAKYAAILARLADAERQLAALQRGPGAAPARASEPGPDEQAEAARVLREERRQQDEAYALGLQNALESQLFDESLDPQWARQTQESISRGLLATAFSGNQLTDLRCQSSLCRMQVRSADRQAQERLIMGYGDIDAFHDSQAYWQRQDQPDGSSVTTLYMMREGAALPTVQRVGKSG